ncbi:MAG: hypothetical protein VB111_11615 [Clostridiaceae bacterium]|nr:hypothetical protein [Clostridiaceae bacterium]
MDIIRQSCSVKPGIFAMNANACTVGGKAFAFTGATVSGKTTLSAFLSFCKGFSFITVLA